MALRQRHPMGRRNRLYRRDPQLPHPAHGTNLPWHFRSRHRTFADANQQPMVHEV